DFSEEDSLVRAYGSFSGVLATPGAIPAIAKAAVVETLKFPFRSGADLLLLASAWLVPGACILISQPKQWYPWLVALLAGFPLTTLGARGWQWYYLPVMPLLAWLVCLAGATFDAALTQTGRRVQWLVIIGVLLAAAPFRTRAMFNDWDWPELGAARRILGSR